MVTWRSDIEALAFQPDGGQAFCMVHRRAFRTLLGFSPTPEECGAYFTANREAFEAAASAKIVEKQIGSGLNFHLTSRDVARHLSSPSSPGLAKL